MWNSRRAKALALVFALFLFQNAIDAVVPGGAPPLLAIGVVYFALSEGPGFGFAVGAFGGAFLELFATGRLGAEIAALGFVGLGCGFLATKLFRDSLLTQLLLPAAALAVFTAANASVFGGPAFRPGELAAAAVLSPLVFLFLGKTAGGR